MKDFYGNHVDDKQLQTFSADVLQDLSELAKIGVKVPPRAFDLARDVTSVNEDSICNFANSMSVTECSDLLISLAQI